MTHSQIPRYLITNGGDERAAKAALQKAAQLAKAFDCSHIALLIPALGTFEYSVFAEILDKKTLKDLLKSKLAIVGQFRLTLESEATFKSFGNREIVLGIYLSDKGLDLLDSITSAKAILFLSWLPEEAEIWANRWSPEIIGEPLSLSPTNVDPELEKELKRLTFIVNLSTGLAHPLDRQKADEMFKTLKAARVKWNPEDIKSWAIRNGWKPAHAEKLALLSKKYLR